MSLTPRQMLILLGLIVAFGVAALVVSQGEADAPEIDQALWCSEAGGLAGTGPIFTGEAADATTDELEALKLALFDVETIAPYTLRPHIARLADFAIIAGQQRSELEWPDAFAATRANKEAVLDEAIAALETEMSSCGLQFG